MGVLTKIYCSYELKDPKDKLNPNDEIEGKFFLENQDKKDKKLKKAIVKIAEVYSEKVITKDADGNDVKNYYDRQVDRQKLEVASKDKIKSGEKKEFDFKIKMPGNWSRKKKNKIKDWHMALMFMQKTGMVASLGADKDSAYCVLPVEGTKRAPSFGDYEALKKKKKKE
jgi:hypothetical protein